MVKKFINQVLQINANKPWVNKIDPNKRTFTQTNNGPPYRSNDNRSRWNDNYNTPLVWNGPSTNPNTQCYRPPERGRTVTCFCCGEKGHYSNQCLNPRKEVGYTPYCGRCCQLGHLPEDCMALPRKFPPSERDYPKNKQVQFQEQNSRPSNHISHILPKEDVFVATRTTTAKQNLENNQAPIITSNGSEPPQILKPTIPINSNSVMEKEIVLPIETNSHLNKEMTWKEQQEKLLKQKSNQSSISLPNNNSNLLNKLPTAPVPSFYQILAKRTMAKTTFPSQIKRKVPRTMKLAMGMEPYDVLANLDTIQPQISLKTIIGYLLQI